jgi:hypothetical protein
MARTSRRGARPHKRCACGATYTIGEWRALPLVGFDGDVTERLEHRNCTGCRSTLVLLTPLVAVSYSVEPIEGGFVIWRRAGAAEELAVGLGARPPSPACRTPSAARPKLASGRSWSFSDASSKASQGRRLGT